MGVMATRPAAALSGCEVGCAACVPLLGGGAQGLAGGVHHVARPGVVVFPLKPQEQTQLVLLLGQAWGETPGDTPLRIRVVKWALN